jgi:hypothetical protein
MVDMLVGTMDNWQRGRTRSWSENYDDVPVEGFLVIGDVDERRYLWEDELSRYIPWETTALIGDVA